MAFIILTDQKIGKPFFQYIIYFCQRNSGFFTRMTE
jgi:hypothetical protein